MTSIFDLETPAVLIDLDVVEANIERTQSLFDQLGIGFRPHIKTHKIPFLAELQMKQGAVGIAAQKISEAEVFAAAGFTDILLCFNLLSAAKIARLRTLMDSCHMTVVADNLDVVRALSSGMSGSQTLLDVLVELSRDAAEELDGPRREAVYYIAADALGNVARHARARHILLRLFPEDGRVVLEITDDGVGFGRRARRRRSSC